MATSERKQLAADAERDRLLAVARLEALEAQKATQRVAIEKEKADDEAAKLLKSKDWVNSDACLSCVRKLDELSMEDWPSMAHLNAKIELEEVATDLTTMTNLSMMCYFTDRSPRLPEFKTWVDKEMHLGRGWPTSQVKFAGKNFFLITFEIEAHCEAALTCAPWFMDRTYIYTFRWSPELDIGTDSLTTLPVWVELPFRKLILESHRSIVAEAMGPILYYIHGEEFSSYPHDRVCILWDTTKEIPRSIRVVVKNTGGLAIWQPVIFKNIPNHYH